MEGVLTPETMKDWGPYANDQSILIYSIGSIDEGHGPALPRQIDDITVIRTVSLICEQTGYAYRGHLPFSSDRVGDIARDWCPAFTEPEKATSGIIEYIRSDLSRWPTKATHIIIMSGHGGNNFLKEREKELSDAIGIHTLYIAPFADIAVNYKELGEVTIGHAGHGEHSVAAYLNVLDRKKLDMMNELAARDPRKALENWKPICGLGWYVLFGGPRYEPLRKPEYGTIAQAEKFLKEKRIVADPELGKEFFNRNLENAMRKIQEFTS